MSLDLSIIIVNWNTKKLLLETIESVYANPPGSCSFEIIVVDNYSSDGSQTALVEAYPAVRLIANRDNRGFGPANNQGLQIAEGRYSLFLNSDTIVQPDSLARIIDFMDTNPRCGMCGIQIKNPDGSFQFSFADYLHLAGEFMILTGLGRRFISPQYPSFSEARSQQNRSVDTISGAFIFTRTAALREIKGFDERFFMYGEENDLGRRLTKAGWTTYYLADVTIIHLGGQSTKQDSKRMSLELQKSKIRLFRIHYGPIPALLLKLLVILALLTKLFVSYLKALKRRSRQTLAWFSWPEFIKFVRTS